LLSRLGLAAPTPGSVDTSFNPSELNGVVRALVIQEDGCALAGGEFLPLAGMSALFRVNTNGIVDQDYRVITEVGTRVLAIALDADENAFVAGVFTRVNGTLRDGLVRLDRSGEVDSGFSPVLDPTDVALNGLVLAPDGTLVFAGRFDKVNGFWRANLARLRAADGRLDTAFNGGWGPDDVVYNLAQLPGGDLVISGKFTRIDGVPVPRLARLDSLGRPNLTFNPAVFIHEIGPLLALPDGRLFSVGISTNLGGLTELRVVSLTALGALDAGFVPPVVTLTERNGRPLVSAMALAPRNHLVIAGYFDAVNGQPRRSVAMLDAHGGLVTSFDPGSGPDWVVLTVAVRPDGRILVGGTFTSFGGLARLGFAQLHGLMEPPTLEPVVIVAPPEPASVPAGMAAAFRVVATGSEPLFYQWFHGGNPLPGATNAVLTLPAVQSVDAGPYQVRVHNATNEVASPEVRLTVMSARTISQQPLDWACFVGEHVTFEISSTPPSARQWVHDGVPVAGATNEVLFVIGTKPSDAGSYWVELTYGEEVLWSRVAHLAVLPRPVFPTSLDPYFVATPGPFTSLALWRGYEQALLAGEFTEIQGIGRERVARLNYDGTLDFTFSPGIGPDGGVDFLAIQADDKVLVAGRFTTFDGVPRNRLARLESSGEVDPGFDPGEGPSNSIKRVRHHPTDRILLGGWFDRYGGKLSKGIAWLTPDGSLDPRIRAATSGSPLYGIVSGVVDELIVLEDQRVLIGGSFTGVSDTLTVTNFPRSVIAGFNPDCTVDQSFDAGSIEGSVRTLVQQPDGNILVGGDFTSIQGTKITNFARISSRGVLDPGFRPPYSPRWALGSSIAVQPDGRILVQGQFQTPSGLRHGLARLYPDGSYDPTFTTGGESVTISGLLALQQDGRIVVAGSYANTTRNINLQGVFRLQGGGGVAPSIVRPPADLIVAEGEEARLAVQAEGDPPLRYLWYAGRGLFGQTNDVLKLPEATIDDTASYSVRVYSDYGQVQTQPVALTVLSARIAPTNRTVVVGFPLFFQGSVPGQLMTSEPIAYSWWKDGEVIPGQTNLALQIATVQPGQDGLYQFAVGAGGAIALSAPARVTLLTPPAITSEPQSQTVSAGGIAMLSVTVSGTPPIEYLWYRYDQALTTQTNATLRIEPVGLLDEGNYCVLVYNNYGAVTSQVARLTVNPSVTFSTGPGSLQATGGQFQFQLGGLRSNLPLVILASPDLQSWTPILTNPTPASSVQFADPIPAGRPQRFYRARQ